MAAIAFRARPKRTLLERDLVTWQTTGVRHILEDIVGRIAKWEQVAQMRHGISQKRPAILSSYPEHNASEPIRKTALMSPHLFFRRHPDDL
ncbi:hypothetical protein TNCV_3024481 [Trichonephila clavipes]|nr:hypothetical protein TNCV_3024481 [Trichonephila clavipes]